MLIDTIAIEAVITLHGFGINIVHTTAMHTRVKEPVCN